jgi:DNA-binding MurR/RpiR family transcriptional regulator
LLSIRDVAGNLRTDPATVLRIVRSLRFRSYREFKANLHDLSIASAISLEGIQAHTSHDSSLNSHGHKALEQDHRNLRALPNTLNRKRVAALVKRIHEARHILLLGGDLAISLVEFLDYRPTLLGFPEIAATTPGHMANATRNCHEDVLDEVLLILQTEIQSS